MPKQPVTGIAHSILTSHRIVKTPDEEFPTDSFIANKAELGGLIHLNAIPGQPDHVPPLTLLNALGEISTTDPSYVPSYLQELVALENQKSTDPQVLSGLGWFHLAKGPNYDENQAKDYLSRAIAAGSKRAEDFLAVSEILVKEGQRAEGERVLLQGKSLFPYDERFYQRLCRMYISTNQYEKALNMLRSSNQLFPEDSFLRQLWQKAEQAVQPTNP
jgi:tetratricopeptide (TPR) repeat protein